MLVSVMKLMSFIKILLLIVVSKKVMFDEIQ